MATAAYRDPAAADYMVKTLAERRDLIARHWFDKAVPLDFFSWDRGTIRFHDLGAERGVFPGTTARYRARYAWVDANRDASHWTAWEESAAPQFGAPLPDSLFYLILVTNIGDNGQCLGTLLAQSLGLRL